MLNLFYQVSATASRLFNVAKSSGKHFNRVFFAHFFQLDFNDAVPYAFNPTIINPGQGQLAAQVTVEIFGTTRQVSKYWGVPEMRNLLQSKSAWSFCWFLTLNFFVIS